MGHPVYYNPHVGGEEASKERETLYNSNALREEGREVRQHREPLVLKNKLRTQFLSKLSVLSKRYFPSSQRVL